jgi:hypothetical protein
VSEFSRCDEVLECPDLSEAEATALMTKLGTPANLTSPLFAIVGGRIVDILQAAPKVHDEASLKGSRLPFSCFLCSSASALLTPSSVLFQQAYKKLESAGVFRGDKDTLAILYALNDKLELHHVLPRQVRNDLVKTFKVLSLGDNGAKVCWASPVTRAVFQLEAKEGHLCPSH